MELDGKFLDSRREVPDPPADALIASVFEADPSATSLDLIRELVRTGATSHPELQPRWQAFCDSEDIGPVDWDKVERAEAVFRRWGPQIVVSLCFGSLAGGYAATHIAHLLLGVSRLESDPKRRVFETAQLLFDVLGPGGLKPGGKGRETSERVRLMHAGVRHLLQQTPRSGPGQNEVRTPNGDLAWDLSWGVPINQELMAGTILTMSAQVLECLATQGVRLSPEDQWAYVYAWFVVGRLMGVQPELVPGSLDEARRFWRVTKERQFAESAAAAEIEQHLLDAMAGLVPLRTMRFIPRAMVIWLNGPEVARMVGLAPLRWHERLRFAGWRLLERTVSWIEVRNRFVRRRLGSTGTKMVQRLDERELRETAADGRPAAGQPREPFSIPAELAGEWALASAGTKGRRRPPEPDK
ncbi:MAG: DUF2236 domain-containing protein [Chloroflexi bacterium]|nr:DUF2236 domain-containing protein [Chloroflexota bacterium]